MSLVLSFLFCDGEHLDCSSFCSCKASLSIHFTFRICRILGKPLMSLTWRFIEIDPDRLMLRLFQRVYIDCVLIRFNMQNTKSGIAPMSKGNKLSNKVHGPMLLGPPILI